MSHSTTPLLGYCLLVSPSTLSSSKVQLKSLPFSAHDSAAGASASHRCESWLDGNHWTTDDLSHAVAADTRNALGAGECILEQPRPTAAGAVDLDQIRATAKGGRLRMLVWMVLVQEGTSVIVRRCRSRQT